eukprot:scaffold14519_cov135-Isochrysis_galbana.AAC.5
MPNTFVIGAGRARAVLRGHEHDRDRWEVTRANAVLFNRLRQPRTGVQLLRIADRPGNRQEAHQLAEPIRPLPS